MGKPGPELLKKLDFGCPPPAHPGPLLQPVETVIIDLLSSLCFLARLAAEPPNLSGPDRTERRCGGRPLKDTSHCFRLLPDASPLPAPGSDVCWFNPQFFLIVPFFLG